MHSQPSRRTSPRSLHLALVASMLAIVTPVAVASHTASAATPTPWTANGPANFSTDSDGLVTPPQMTYNLLDVPVGARFSDKTWTFSTTAISDFTDVVPYTYTGFHAYFAVRVHVDAFVIHNGITTTNLVTAGPVNCCTPPSGGFTYTGNHAFDVVTGDVYGFTIGGVNFDSNQSFHGTLTLAPPATSPFTDPAAVAANTSWTNAAPLTAAGVNGSLTQAGEVRWYKFPIQPDSQVQVDLSNLDQNFDLTMFRDIGQTFTSLTTAQDLTRLSAQFAGDVFSPSVYSPSVYSPSVYSPSVYSPSVYSPSVYSPSVYSPSVYSPSVYSPSVYSPSVYSPSVYSPSVYSPSVYSPSTAFLQAFSSAQTRSLIGVSAHENADAESIRTATWNNTGDFYVRVQGRNGAFSATPFHLGLTTTGGACTAPLDSFSGLSTIAGTPGSVQTVILTDSSRFAPLAPGLITKLRELETPTGGKVIDLSNSARITALNSQADLNKACPYAKNLVAEAIRDVVNSYRDNNNTLKYVVVAGGDSIIPFFRYADSAGIGPESDFVPPALDASPSQASLRRNYVLGQDAYGAVSDLNLKGAVLPVPDLAVGRLVETPGEIAGMVDAYLGLNGGVLPQATSSLVTGYDFLTSAADSVQTDFAAGLGSTGRAETLITNQGVPTTTTTLGAPSRTRSWTATDLSNALLGSHHDLVFLAGHFSAFSALAADYQTSLSTADLDAHPDLLTNSLVISAGCHAGYNLLDAEGVPGLVGLDWPEAMARQRATLIAGTGYQYADTDFLAYSAKLYTLLASQLRSGAGAVSLGQALVNAKQDYLAGVSTLGGIDQKALIESTLYGLPMTGINLPHGRTTDPGNGAGITPAPVAAATPGAQLGLKTAPLTITPTLTPPPPKQVLDTAGIPVVPTAFFNWFTGRDGVQSGPALPALPKQIDDVTSTSGEVLRGVGFTGGTYTDATGVTPLTGAPTTEQNGIHTSFVSPVFYPQKLATVNYFGALDGNGTDGRTRLITTPAQYRSEANTTTDTERKYSQLGLQLYYSNNTLTYGNNTPALAAPPSISGVADTVLPDAVSVSAHITGDPSAGIQKTWVTYTAETGSLHGAWQSTDLVQDPVDSTLWTGTFVLPVGQTVADVRYIVQAVNGVGLVGLDNNLGDGYTPGKPVGVPVPPPAITTTTVVDPVPVSGVSGTSLTIGATTSAPTGSVITFALGNASITAISDGAGRATATLPLQDAVGGYTLSASYGGDATRRGSSSSRPFGITSVPTALTLSAGAATTLSAVLTRTAPSIPLPQQTVYFTVTGPSLVTTRFTATSDPQGRAHVPTGSLPDGTYTVTAQFLGTPSTLLPSTSLSTVNKVDTIGPVVTLTPAGTAGTNGWFRSDVSVTTTGTDATSGVSSCSAAQSVHGQAAGVTVTGSCSDNAGNVGSASTLVKIDSIGPTLSPTVSPNVVLRGTTPTVSAGVVSDATSGVASYSCDAAATAAIGSATVNCSATDVAGNTTWASAPYRVYAMPTVLISGASATNEGATYSLTLGAVSDLGTDTVSSYVVHWGDGTADTYSTNGVKTHTFVDGPLMASVTVDLVDSDGTFLNRANPVSVTVANVAPTITGVSVAATQTLTGAQVTFTGSAIDASTFDRNTGFVWQWSVDGGAYTSFGATNVNTFTTIFATCGTHTVAARARDKDLGVSASVTSAAVSVYDAHFLAPLNEGLLNTVQKGRVVPVKISIGCNGAALSGLTPAIQLLAGDQTAGNETAADAVETLSVSPADTTGLMRPNGPGYIYNLQIPSTAAAGALFTIRVRPVSSTADIRVVVKIQK